MDTASKTIETARKEIGTVLKRHSLTWQDIVPDIDKEIWQKIEPGYRRIRRGVFKQYYPKLYARYFSGKKTKSRP